MISRIPKRGFNNKNFSTEYQIINLAALEEKFEDGNRVDSEALKASRMIEDATKPVKILGNGELKKKLTIVAQKFSATAREKIAAVGGSVEEVK